MDSSSQPTSTNRPSLVTLALTSLIDLDTRLSLYLHSLFLPFPRSLLKLLEISGDGRFWFPIPISLFWFADPKLKIFSLFLLVGSLLDLALVGLLKFTIRRPRPVYNKGMHLTVGVDHWSFPSGHSSRACFVGFFLWLCSDLIEEFFDGWSFMSGLKSWEFVRGDWMIDLHGGFRFAGLVVLWSVATSFSRVLLGRHFVLDVMAGAMLGVLEALFMFHFFRWYSN
ncbi:probable lipid phosphate phosphatase beta [Amborella trichopoda]|uniref:Phosphatidic acid phosphatase type 2/haloperoxidase domain-containing protein n=1 Tax=Amborella trichopoda TaxID=13333 RepID=U5D390_AMBTC|nr:probable lipid phosphate phosphatase beta [Amborella trichopoda]ERN14833.1 hypothetical protein AMTR_s00032p00116380 [Amborella trichopoda]|eukprot:XP_006853366.1 probable lipid phosphate phosphatase beta [Amborella trichopoda]